MEGEIELPEFLNEIEHFLSFISELINADSHKIWKSEISNKFKAGKEFIKGLDRNLKEKLSEVGLSGEELCFKAETFHNLSKKIKSEINKLDFGDSRDLVVDWTNYGFQQKVKECWREIWDKIKGVILKLLSIINSLLKSLVSFFTGISVLSINSAKLEIKSEKAVEAAWAIDSVIEFKEILETFLD